MIVLAIRDAREADEAAVRVLLEQMGYSPSELGDLHGRFPRLLESGEHRILLAVDGGAIVGLACLVFSQSIEQPAPNCRLNVIVTDVDRRREGIATAMLKAAETAAQRAGCYRIELTSAHDNVGAHAAYRSAGYVETGLRFKKVF